MSWIIVAIFSVLILILWSKIKALENKTSELSTAKLTLRPKSNLFAHPILKELAGVDKKYYETPFKDLPDTQREKLRGLIQEIEPKIRIGMRFFYDKNIVFVNSKGFIGFQDIPKINEYLISESLGETKEGFEVEFLIKYRVVKNALQDRNMTVYTGYLKKHKFLDKDKDKKIILFDMPEYLINPMFINEWKKSSDTTNQLVEKFGLDYKTENDFASFEGDFGETEYFTGRNPWYENEYYEIYV